MDLPEIVRSQRRGHRRRQGKGNHRKTFYSIITQQNITYTWHSNTRNTMFSQYVHRCIHFGESKLYIDEGLVVQIKKRLYIVYESQFILIKCMKC